MSDRDKRGIARLNRVIATCNKQLHYLVTTREYHTHEEIATGIEHWLSRRDAVKKLREEIFPSTQKRKDR